MKNLSRFCLNLSFTEISDAGAREAFRMLEGCKKAKEIKLYFSNNNI
jgi:hypothetical protein